MFIKKVHLKILQNAQDVFKGKLEVKICSNSITLEAKFGYDS